VQKPPIIITLGQQSTTKPHNSYIYLYTRYIILHLLFVHQNIRPNILYSYIVYATFQSHYGIEIDRFAKSIIEMSYLRANLTNLSFLAYLTDWISLYMTPTVV